MKRKHNEKEQNERGTLKIKKEKPYRLKSRKKCNEYNKSIKCKERTLVLDNILLTSLAEQNDGQNRKMTKREKSVYQQTKDNKKEETKTDKQLLEEQSTDKNINSEQALLKRTEQLAEQTGGEYKKMINFNIKLSEVFFSLFLCENKKEISQNDHNNEILESKNEVKRLSLVYFDKAMEHANEENKKEYISYLCSYVKLNHDAKACEKCYKWADDAMKKELSLSFFEYAIYILEDCKNNVKRKVSKKERALKIDIAEKMLDISIEGMEKTDICEYLKRLKEFLKELLKIKETERFEKYCERVLQKDPADTEIKLLRLLEEQKLYDFLINKNERSIYNSLAFSEDELSKLSTNRTYLNNSKMAKKVRERIDSFKDIFNYKINKSIFDKVFLALVNTKVMKKKKEGKLKQMILYIEELLKCIPKDDTGYLMKKLYFLAVFFYRYENYNLSKVYAEKMLEIEKNNEMAKKIICLSIKKMNNKNLHFI